MKLLPTRNIWNNFFRILFQSLYFIHFTGDYNVNEIYHYATSATYQMSGGSPPPPAPPSPPLHAHSNQIDVQMQHRRMSHDHDYQMDFATMVYQPASLHEVDEPNVVSNTYVLVEQPVVMTGLVFMKFDLLKICFSQSNGRNNNRYLPG